MAAKGTTALARTGASLTEQMAAKYSMAEKDFMNVVRGTLVAPVKQKDGTSRQATDAEIMGCLAVAHQYDLNPLIREIYFFVSAEKGGIIPIVPVDGWIKKINEQKRYAGMEFIDHLSPNRELEAITCKIHIWNDPKGVNPKYGKRTVEATEYLAECMRDTMPWKKWPHRMLRHKALMQAARYAFGLSGIYDEDEAERIANAQAIDVTPELQRVLAASEVAALPEGQPEKDLYRPAASASGATQSSSSPGAAAAGASESKLDEAGQRRFIQEVAERAAKAEGVSVGDIITRLSSFQGSSGIVSRSELSQVKAGRWLGGTYAKAKELKAALEAAGSSQAPPERKPGEDPADDDYPPDL
jgi:phage recombination protein Bet